MTHNTRAAIRAFVEVTDPFTGGWPTTRLTEKREVSLSKAAFNHVQLRRIEEQYGVQKISYEILADVDRARWVWWKQDRSPHPHLGAWHSIETDSDFDAAFPVLVAAIRLTA